MPVKLIFHFKTAATLQAWTVVNDSVMGGKSSGSLKLSPEGFGIFEGEISLDNNGGFSSVRHRFPRILIGEHTKLSFKIKGDRKKYQVRLKTNAEDSYSYITYFETTGEWQEIEIPLKEMYPSFRGRKLNQPNLSQKYIEEIAFLIGNKKQETFRILLDKIKLL